MLIYEKRVHEEGELQRTLYGTPANIPAETDQPLVYLDPEKQDVDPLSSYTYLDDGHGGINMVDTEGSVTNIQVFVKDEEGNNIQAIPAPQPNPVGPNDASAVVGEAEVGKAEVGNEG